MDMAVGNVQVLSNTIVRPYSPDPSIPPTYHNTIVPLTIFDVADYNCHIPTFYAFRPPMPDNQDLKDGLVKALIHYPHLAGSFTSDDLGHPCILLDDFGVRLIETYVPTLLEEHLPFDASSNLTNLLPPLVDVEELFQVQLNRFACGGLAIGLTSQHRVADGQSISSFLVAWAKTVRGLDVHPLPYHDRAAISVPRNPPRYDFRHDTVEFKKKPLEPPTLDVAASLSTMTNVGIHYSKDFIAKLKLKVTDGDRGKRCSTFQCILAHIWKKVTHARGLGDDEVTQVRAAVNGRLRMKPPVPMEYFGNLVLWAFPKMKVKELLGKSYAQVVGSIRQSVAKVDDSYFRSFIDFGEMMKRGELKEELMESMPAVGESLCPNMEFNSWLGLQFHEVDFGKGGPCGFLPPHLPVEGLTILVPSCMEEGGVDVFMSLKHKHAALLKHYAYTLD